MRRSRLEEILAQFPARRVLVVGDCMLDEYLWGRVSRISPEAPVMVVEQERTTYAAGGASNVAVNVVALGAAARMAGLVGEDAMGERLCEELGRIGVDTAGVLRVPGRPTTRKTRIVAHSQQVVRVDLEDRSPIAPEREQSLLERVLRLAPGVDAVVFSDYNKGALTAALVSGAAASVRGAGGVVLANPKPANIGLFHGLDLVSLNHSESEAVAGHAITDEDSLLRAGRRLVSLTGCGGVFVTRGGQGIDVFCRDGSRHHVSGITEEVYDVTGAGDSVIATAALALASGASFAEAATLANYAGNAKVRKLGVVPVTREDVRAIWELAEGLHDG
jgi:D-beta-D-heptose 7-phosphate kinase/D-beta-D-heptose 1-phosphate adenosyltransferase